MDGFRSVQRREGERERMEMDTTDLSYIKVVADCGTCLWRAVFALAKQYRYQISQHDSICSRRYRTGYRHGGFLLTLSSEHGARIDYRESIKMTPLHRSYTRLRQNVE